MKKYLFALALIVILPFTAGSQSCSACPECDQNHLEYCETGYAELQSWDETEYLSDKADAAYSASECLRDYGDYGGVNADLANRLEGTRCEEVYNTLNDQALDKYVDNMSTSAETFHECCGLAGCGNGW